MENISLIVVVFLLGVRHGLDADHLACIDGLTRYNCRVKSPISRWVGTLFSVGHGFVVACIAIILGLFMKHFKMPELVDTLATWISILSLFCIGTLNLYNLLRTKSRSDEGILIRGIKGKLLPRILQETTNPFLVIFIGGVFAMAADTVSQTSLWAIAAGNSGSYMLLFLGIIFMIGMMLTDTIDSIVVYRIINQSNLAGHSVSRVMGWIIIALAYGVCIYQALKLFIPNVNLDIEVAGAIIFLSMFLCLVLVVFKVKNRSY